MSEGLTFPLRTFRTRGRPAERVWSFVGVAGIVLLCIGLTPATGQDMTSDLLAALGAVCLVMFPVAMSNLRARDDDGELVIDKTRGGIIWRWRRSNEERFVPQASLVAGYRTGASSGIVRETDGRAIDLTLVSDDPETLDHVFHAMGLDVGQRATRAPLHRRFGGLAVGLVATLVFLLLPYLGTALYFRFVQLLHYGYWLSTGWDVFTDAAYFPLRTLWFYVLLPLIAATLTGYAFRSSSLLIGDDGLRIESGGLRRSSKLLAYSAIGKVDLAPNGVVVAENLREKKHFLPLYGQMSGEIRGLIDRIEAAREKSNLRGRDVESITLLARGSRTVAEWRAALAAQVTAAGSFRDLALPEERLEQVLGDAGSAHEERVAAALALRALRPNAQMMIRVAAEASADPRLRGALEAAAEDEIDDTAIEHALNLGATREGERT